MFFTQVTFLTSKFSLDPVTLDCLERTTPLTGPPARLRELLELELDISPCHHTHTLYILDTLALLIMVSKTVPFGFY
jgi:hypothetical protein